MTKISPGWLIIILDLIVVALLGGSAWYAVSLASDLQTDYRAKSLAAAGATWARENAGALTETAEARSQLHQALIGAETLPDFIGQLETFASASGAELTIASVIPPKDKEPRVRVNLKLLGSFAQLWHFVSLLENSPAEWRATRAEWQKIAEEGAGWELYLNLELV